MRMLTPTLGLARPQCFLIILRASFRTSRSLLRASEIVLRRASGCEQKTCSTMIDFVMMERPLLLDFSLCISDDLSDNDKSVVITGAVNDFWLPPSAEVFTCTICPKPIKGTYVYDINGKKYLDAFAGLWCTVLGGSEPRLVAAATKQLNTLPFYHSFWNRAAKPSLDLAKELIEMFTARKMGKVFFTNSGSEANDTQVKLVWYYNNALGRPNKKKFIARSKSYHGSTLVAASLSGLPALHEKFDLPLSFVLHTDCPHYWRFHLPGETEEEFSTRLASSLENLILKEGPETIAAFIAEPIMGSGGIIPPPKTYFEKIQAVIRKYDILFIADEVITAFGRLGTMFGCDKYNIQPDLVSIAKALSSGYMPIGAVLISPEISEVIHSQSNKLGSFSHGFTYSGHPVSCAVALETLKIYRERNITEHVQAVSQKFQEGIRSFSDSPIIGEIRGVGLILATEFTDNKSPTDPFPSEWGVGSFFGEECSKRGLLMRIAGDSIMMSPSFIFTEKEINELINIYGEALKSTERRVLELKSQAK